MQLDWLLIIGEELMNWWITGKKKNAGSRLWMNNIGSQPTLIGNAQSSAL